MEKEFDPISGWWQKRDGTVVNYREEYFPADHPDFLAYLEAGDEVRPYPRNLQGQESRDEFIKVLKGWGLMPEDVMVIDGERMKVKFSKKDFLLWCGLESIIKLNAAIAAGNMMAKTVHDLLFAADYIDVTDSASVQMVHMLTTEAAGKVLTANDAARILQGEKYENETYNPGGDTDSSGGPDGAA